MSLSATSALLIKMSVVSVAKKKLPLTRACALLDLHGVAVSHAGLSPADVAVPCACLELRTPLSGVTYTHVWCYGHPCPELRTPCPELRTPQTGVTDIPVWSYVHPCLVFRTPLSGATDTPVRIITYLASDEILVSGHPSLFSALHSRTRRIIS